jgi:hypothetical protein
MTPGITTPGIYDARHHPDVTFCGVENTSA